MHCLLLTLESHFWWRSFVFLWPWLLQYITYQLLPSTAYTSHQLQYITSTANFVPSLPLTLLPVPLSSLFQPPSPFPSPSHSLSLSSMSPPLPPPSVDAIDIATYLQNEFQ